jgi:hypothetical protein
VHTLWDHWSHNVRTHCGKRNNFETDSCTTKSLSHITYILFTEVSFIFIVSWPLEFPRRIRLPSETGVTVFSYRSTRDFCVLNEHTHWLEIYLLSRYSTISQWLIVIWFLLVDIWVDGLNESLQQSILYTAYCILHTAYCILYIRSTEVEWYTCGEWETVTVFKNMSLDGFYNFVGRSNFANHALQDSVMLHDEDCVLE